MSHGGRIGTVQEIRYTLGGWEHTAAPQNVEEWISYCGLADWEPGCCQFTRFKVSIPEVHVREVAATFDGDPRRPFMLELRERKGRSATLGFAPAELGGLVKAFDEWRIREQRGS